MPQASSTNGLFERAASKVVDVFGERDRHGNFIKITCTLPSGKELELVGVIVGQLRVTDEIQDESGTTVRDQIEDVVELSIPRKQRFGTYSPLTETKFDLSAKHPGKSFTLLEVVSQTDSFATVRCSRTHIVRIQSQNIENT